MPVTRRDFLSTMAVGAAMLSSGALGASARAAAPSGGAQTGGRYRPEQRFGLGGVALGNGFHTVTSDEAAYATMEAAWESGVRYFDTSPWYGLGLSERRMGHFLHARPRGEYVLSTKIGRLLSAADAPPKGLLWERPDSFDYRYDYTSDGTRRSVEDSLQRLGISSIDIVFIHDLSPDNKDMAERWLEYFNTAAKGAMRALTAMREEGIIKGWGLGVNTPEPILRTLQVAQPDICLAACQYSLMKHDDALRTLFPACEKAGTSLVIGSPLDGGFLAGRDRYLYEGKMPSGFKDKRAKIEAIARNHGTDLRTAALQFCSAPSVVASVIPGARSAEQVKENAASMDARIPPAFWAELKAEKLIAKDAPEPETV